MSFEIERKFLVLRDAWRNCAIRHTGIRQAYLDSNAKVSIRVRIEDDSSATLTLKSRSSKLRRREFEYAVPTSDAEELILLRRQARDGGTPGRQARRRLRHGNGSSHCRRDNAFEVRLQQHLDCVSQENVRSRRVKAMLNQTHVAQNNIRVRLHSRESALGESSVAMSRVTLVVSAMRTLRPLRPDADRDDLATLQSSRAPRRHTLFSDSRTHPATTRRRAS